MKKLVYGGLFLAFIGIGIVGCKKEEFTQRNSISEESNSSYTLVNKSNFTNPFDVVGENTYDLLGYMESYLEDIYDTTVYCPIEFSRSGNKIYSTKTKMLNRTKQFAIDKNLPILSNSELSSIYDSFSIADPYEKLQDLVSNNELSPAFQRIVLDLNTSLLNCATPADIFDSTLIVEQIIYENESNLTSDEIELLYSIVSGVKYTAKYMVDNDITVLPYKKPGLPCGGAIVGYGAGFVGLCLATGPIGWTVGVIGFASGVWGVFDNCK